MNDKYEFTPSQRSKNLLGGSALSKFHLKWRRVFLLMLFNAIAVMLIAKAADT
ncbi:MAG: hypothetical protein ACJAUP_001674 [Cellvibrionaceae bacterium]